MKKILLIAALLLAGVVLRAQEFSVSTNFADLANLGTLNVEGSYGFNRHWTLMAGVKYNPFSYRSGDTAFQRRQRLFSAGSRWWPWHIYSGWWVSGKLQYQEYNNGGIRSEETTEGNRFGAGFGGGYSKMLTKWLNFDVGVGFWAGYDIYTVYTCPTCGQIVSNGRKCFILPNDILISLSFIF